MNVYLDTKYRVTQYVLIRKWRNRQYGQHKAVWLISSPFLPFLFKAYWVTRYFLFEALVFVSVPWLSDAAYVTATTPTRQQTTAQDADTLILMMVASTPTTCLPARDPAHSFTAPLASIPDTKHKLN